MGSSPGAALCLALLIATAILAALLLTPRRAYAQVGACGKAVVVVEGGKPSPFILPDDAGRTVRVERDAVLRIRGAGIPPNTRMRWSLGGIGSGIGGQEYAIGSGSVVVNVADYSSHVRGLYEVTAMLLTGAQDVCATAFRVHVAGFGGTAATAAAAASAVAAVGALASAPVAASGMQAKLRLNVSIHRRRPHGWRRCCPYQPGGAPSSVSSWARLRGCA